ncbi:MAG: signal peptidase II [Alphaproteobacteria bacterium]|jgi:signal peptidase II|nr:signal peptidase II [Alphaproteobacteria bacterium]
MNLLKSFTPRQLILLALSIVVLVVLDQIVKYVVSSNMILYYDYISILPFLEIRYIINTGVSFSFLDGLDYKLIAIISFSAIILATYLIVSFYKVAGIELIIVLSLLLAGSIGNLIDRLRLGGVIDYIHVFWGQYSFPIFNLADIYINFCALIIIKNVILNKKS